MFLTMTVLSLPPTPHRVHPGRYLQKAGIIDLENEMMTSRCLGQPTPARQPKTFFRTRSTILRVSHLSAQRFF